MRAGLIALALGALAATSAGAQQQHLRADQTAFRAIYQELVNIDTSMATGSCTRAAEAMAARLRAAGYGDNDLAVIVPEGAPNDANVVAVLHGQPRGPADAHAILLLAHIDVVDARREDWQRDPFTLVEENGFFYGRGAADDKAMASVWVDLMIRLKQENYHPTRTIRMALTCGEETSDRVNGVEYLLAHNRDWLAADFALNEGAGGTLDANGRRIALNIQAGEKVHQVFQLEVTNPGGHSSRPVPDNAIYRLSAGLSRLSQFSFPLEVNPVVQAYFARMAAIVGGDTGAAMAVLGRDPTNAQAAATLSANPSYNALMRTTCVATMLNAGHAANALPQRADATLSCRIMQGHAPEEIQATLQQVLNDPQIGVTIIKRRDGSQAPPLTPVIMAPVEHVAAHMWPHVAIIPLMTPGATDGRYLNTAGIATYGLSGMFAAEGETNAHGLNEKIRVRSLYEGRDFLTAVVREYAMQSVSP
jgi:acetylornithine deacetylase/succinyl-diaminopimelate desuccinylase-like protein